MTGKDDKFRDDAEVRVQAEKTLRESERRYQQLFEAESDAILLIENETGRILEANTAALTLFGYERNELLGRVNTDLSAEPEKTQKITRNTPADPHSVINVPLRFHRKKDGTVFPVEITGRFFVWEGRPVHIAAIRDITERERAAEALRESEQRHRTILQTAMDGFWLVDTQGRLLDVNEAYCRMSGYSEQELRAMRISDLESLETANDTAAHVQKVMVTGEDRFESVHRRKDGSVFDVEISVQYRPIEGGRLVAFLRDITERKRIEEALRASEEKFRLLIENMNTGVFQSTLTGAFLHMNGATAEMAGYRVEELMSQPATCLYADLADRERLNASLLQHGQVRNLEVRCVRKDGTQQWISLNAVLQRDKDGTPERILGIVSDITERKQAEGEKVRLETQLQHAQKMESVGRLAGGVAHDFNNMLGVILGHTELAMEQVEPAQPLHADLEEIRKAAEHSANLTRQLLAFARKQTAAPKVLDVNQIVMGMLKMLGRLIGENIQLNWQPKADLWPVNMDPSQLDQILANLCVNARDAIAGVGKITIETENIAFDPDYSSEHVGCTPGEYVKLTVSDTGCGMDRETQSHLFEPFFTTKGVGAGTGLGLATVYGIVKQNNGLINVYSEPGHGTTFTIYLPRHVSKTGQPRTEDAAAPAKRGHETILLVEDESLILTMTTTMLQKQGYTVLAASTPGEAIRLAREHAGEIHLLMTDVVMPEMNGRDLARNLLSLYPGIKRLFMSGYTADVIAHHGVLDEGVCFMQKPFSMRSLSVKVREALDRV